MKPGSIQSKIVALEAFGLGLIVLISWLDELTNLTGHLFGDAYVPNWHEALLESGIVLLVGLPIVLVTRRLTGRLHYLEGFVKMCAWCRKVEDAGQWTSVEHYMESHLDTQTSHGICPDCRAKLLADLPKSGRTKN